MQGKIRKYIWSAALALLVVALGAVLLVHAARAQTPARPAMPGQDVGGPFTGAQTVQSAPLPVPDDMVEQAREQNEGSFGPMQRPRTAGQIQSVWDYAETTDGVYETDLCKNCTYRVRAREYLVTVIELPKGEVITKMDRGDPNSWMVEKREPNKVAVRPKGFGYDTSLIVYGASGITYPFYLRAEAINSQNIPDLLVRIKGFVGEAETMSVPMSANGVSPETLPAMNVPGGSPAGKAVADLTGTDPGSNDGDFVPEAAFDPDKLRGWGQYDLWGDEALKPVTVFRDDYFTYIRYGEKWKDLEVPTAYVVVDGIDELVNTRVQGQTFIVESTQKLITLKSGKTFLCIEFKGEA